MNLPFSLDNKMAWVSRAKRRFDDSAKTPVIRHNDKLHCDLFSRFVLPDSWEKLDAKALQIIFQGSTQVSEMKSYCTNFENDFVEQSYRNKANTSLVDVLEVIRPHWEQDYTGEEKGPRRD